MLEVRAGKKASPTGLPHRLEAVYAFIEFE